MAYAARQRGCALTIFVGVDASPMKIERMRDLGARICISGTSPGETLAAARTFASQHGALLVEDGRCVALAEGAGVIGIELLRWRAPLDAILVPLGDGALLSGIGCWVKAHSPRTRMIGVCAAGSPAMERAWRTGQIARRCASNTIADGLAVDAPYPEALANVRSSVDDVLLVEDAALIGAMQCAHAELGLVLEPSGAAGLAALNVHRDQFVGETVATVLTGGNLGPEDMRRWLL